MAKTAIGTAMLEIMQELARAAMKMLRRKSIEDRRLSFLYQRMLAAQRANIDNFNLDTLRAYNEACHAFHYARNRYGRTAPELRANPKEFYFE